MPEEHSSFSPRQKGGERQPHFSRKTYYTSIPSQNEDNWQVHRELTKKEHNPKHYIHTVTLRSTFLPRK